MTDDEKKLRNIFSVSSKMTVLKLISGSSEQTQRLGMRLGELAQSDDVFLLTGNLGSGKTCLTQGIGWGLGVKEYAFSPSFVIIREYHGRLPLYHIDFYRLDRIEEIVDLGLDEYLYGKGVCVVEWADKGIAVLPKEHLLINLSYLSDTERSISLEPKGHRYAELLKSLGSDSKTWS
jgi:tRNA threonylcarbamoyladenosine biosynthesis protein TsaE